MFTSIIIPAVSHYIVILTAESVLGYVLVGRLWHIWIPLKNDGISWIPIQPELPPYCIACKYFKGDHFCCFCGLSLTVKMLTLPLNKSFYNINGASIKT